MPTSKKRKKPSSNPAKGVQPKTLTPSDEEFSATWIRTEHTIDGKGWMVTVELDEDTAIALDFEETVVYVRGVLTAAARAEYEASVLKQISTKVGGDKLEGSGFTRQAFMLVQDLRKDQPEIDFGRMSETISLAPGINVKGEAFLTVLSKGEALGQWSLRDARVHALSLLEAHSVADLDQAYKTALLGIVNLEPETADIMIDDLRNHRPDL